MTAEATVSVVQSHFAAVIAASDRFFADESVRIAECCRRMAERFGAGGTLLVAGEGAQWSDAQHVSVEFVHPILVGKRALPAVAVTGHRLQTLAGANDIFLAMSAGEVSGALDGAIGAARERGLLTIVVSADRSSHRADMPFVVDGANPLIAQEVTETLYHVLWELVHVFLDARDQLLPVFVANAAGTERDDAALVAEVVASTRQKASDVTALRRALLDRVEREILQAGAAMADRFARGGRLLAFGNGGSATDAQDAVADATAPPFSCWRTVPALALTDDVGVITAIANDVGYDHVFARQVAAFGRPGDVAIAFSTSGASRNLIAALTMAKQRGLLTMAMSGGEGGALSRSSDVDFCFTAPSEQLPRIQEAHATTWHALLTAAQEQLR